MDLWKCVSGTESYSKRKVKWACEMDKKLETSELNVKTEKVQLRHDFLRAEMPASS